MEAGQVRFPTSTAFYEKILPGANDLTLNELDEDRYQGEIAWTSATTRNHSWGIKANAEFRDRKGNRNSLWRCCE